MKIVLSDAINSRIKSHQAPGTTWNDDGYQLPNGDWVVDLSRDVIERLLKLVPDSDTWDEVVGLAILLSK